MRLSNQTILILKEIIVKYITDPKIILFGSRIYDNKKGGDIDMLVEVQENIDLKTQIKILAECKIKGIDRKIDMIFKTAIKEGIIL